MQSWKEFSASQFSRLYITALPGCCPLPWRGVRWGASVSVGVSFAVVLFIGGVLSGVLVLVLVLVLLLSSSLEGC